MTTMLRLALAATLVATSAPALAFHAGNEGGIVEERSFPHRDAEDRADAAVTPEVASVPAEEGAPALSGHEVAPDETVLADDPLDRKDDAGG